MRLIRSVCAVAFTLVATASVSEAAVISYTDIFDPTDVLMDNQGGTCIGNNTLDTVSGFVGGKCDTLSYIHTVTPPYVPGVDTLTLAQLTIWLYDNDDQAADKLEFTLDGLLSSPVGGLLIPDSSHVGDQFTHQLSVVAQVQDNGTLNLVLSRQAGDFYFAKSTLTIRGETGTTLVAPEPATLALFGLAGAASAIRRRRHV